MLQSSTLATTPQRFFEMFKVLKHLRWVKKIAGNETLFAKKNEQK